MPENLIAIQLGNNCNSYVTEETTSVYSPVLFTSALRACSAGEQWHENATPHPGNLLSASPGGSPRMWVWDPIAMGVGHTGLQQGCSATCLCTSNAIQDAFPLKTTTAVTSL